MKDFGAAAGEGFILNTVSDPIFEPLFSSEFAFTSLRDRKSSEVAVVGRGGGVSCAPNCIPDLGEQ